MPGQVQAAIGAGQKFFGVRAVGRIMCLAYMETEERLAASLRGRLDGKASEFGDLLLDRGGGDIRKNNDELVAAHAGHAIVFAARGPQLSRKQGEHVIPRDMPEAVANVFQPVELANQNSEFCLSASSATAHCRGGGTTLVNSAAR